MHSQILLFYLVYYIKKVIKVVYISLNYHNQFGMLETSNGQDRWSGGIHTELVVPKQFRLPLREKENSSSAAAVPVSGGARTPATAAAAAPAHYKRLPIVQQLNLTDISNFLNMYFYDILHENFFVRNQFLRRKN